MKYLFALLFCLSLTQFATAQSATSARVATNLNQDPLYPKELEVKRFSSQVQRLQTAYAAKDANQVNVSYSALLTGMREALDQRQNQPVALSTAATDLSKMQQIFAVFVDFVGFDVATPADAQAKLKLLGDFQQVLQQQYEALKMAAGKQ